MVERYCYESVDRLFRDIMHVDQTFGGKMFILAGDFRQNLPVIPKANRAEVVSKTIKKSHLWLTFTTIKLSINERVRRNTENSLELNDFCNFLLKMGDGDLPIELGISHHSVRIPDQFVSTRKTVEEFVNDIYNDVNDASQYTNCAILSTTNKNVDLINDICLNKHLGDVIISESADEIDQDGSDILYPVEFLNSLQPSGMPPHRLMTKIGAPVILLRNLNPSQGLCNGTRLEIVNVQKYIITAKILTGSHRNDITMIPRINLCPSETNFPFKLTRRQFPLRLAYSMTINKSQGQSINKIGIYLPQPVFSHGQLYVAFSRAENPNNIKVFVENVPNVQGVFPGHEGVYTENVVYKDVFV